MKFCNGTDITHLNRTSILSAADLRESARSVCIISLRAKAPRSRIYVYAFLRVISQNFQQRRVSLGAYKRWRETSCISRGIYVYDKMGVRMRDNSLCIVHNYKIYSSEPGDVRSLSLEGRESERRDLELKLQLHIAWLQYFKECMLEYIKCISFRLTVGNKPRKLKNGCNIYI